MKKSAGVLPFYGNSLHMLYDIDTELYSDFGGKKEESETQEECAWREALEEGGFTETDVVEYYGEFRSDSYLCILVRLNKAPVPVSKNTEVRQVNNYNEIANFRYSKVNGRLFIKELQRYINMRMRRMQNHRLL